MNLRWVLGWVLMHWVKYCNILWWVLLWVFNILGGRCRRGYRNQHGVRPDGAQHEGRGLARHRGWEEDDLWRNQRKRRQTDGVESRLGNRVNISLKHSILKRVKSFTQIKGAPNKELLASNLKLCTNDWRSDVIKLSVKNVVKYNWCTFQHYYLSKVTENNNKLFSFSFPSDKLVYRLEIWF